MHTTVKPKAEISIIEWRTTVGVLLSDERVRGDIILTSIAYEACLDSFLRDYFAFPPKQSEFERIVLNRLSMAQKIEIFSGLGFCPSLKSFPELVAILKGMNRLRNHAAHVSWGDGEKVIKLADNEFTRRFFEKYPQSSTATTYRMRKLFSSLRKTKQYQAKEYQDADILF